MIANTKSFAMTKTHEFVSLKIKITSKIVPKKAWCYLSMDHKTIVVIILQRIENIIK